MELVKSQNYRILKYILIVFLGSILLAISSKIKIPFYPVPMTMQTFVVLFLGMSFGYKVGLATVYRVLTHFEKVGILVRSNFESGKSVYEMNRGTHHDHLVCTNCGRVEEFLDPEIENRQKIIAESKGFSLTDHSLALYGVCSNCSSSTKKK